MMKNEALAGSRVGVTRCCGQVLPRQWARQAAVLASGLLAVVVCALVMGSSGDSSKPSVESMYHMWLGPNGLPVSPRKQRGLLFQFCTTNFVTEAEMRYCYARLLSVGNPSGPVKFSGQPQYDSEQVVSPLFTFSAPPMGDAAAAPPPAAAQQIGGAASLAAKSYEAPQQAQQLQLKHLQPQAVLPQAQEVRSQSQAAAIPRPTSMIVPEAGGKARVVTAVKLPRAVVKAGPQSEWAAFEAAQQASKVQWLEQQENAQRKAQVHAAAAARVQGLLPRLNALPKMKAEPGSAQLALSGPWYKQESALAI